MYRNGVHIKAKDGITNKALYVALGKAKILFSNYVDYGKGLQLKLIRDSNWIHAWMFK